mmetsp:Transcript_37569/g.75732  ORF Transcript_37569/g.75732 Transcript_37569/m.75732 type:complete len:348 (+) Transcript_37569:68-1111(+)
MIVETLCGAPDRTAPRQLALNAQDSKAVCQAIVAAESRKAAIGVAECLVRIKELDSTASVEQRRLAELGATERCRITQEEQSKRFGRWADVAQVSALESAKTERQAIAAKKDVCREAVAAHARVEMCRAQSSMWSSSMASYGLLLFAFVAGTTRAPRLPTRRARSAYRVVKAALLVALLSLAARRTRIVSAVCRLEPGQALALARRASGCLAHLTRLAQAGASWLSPPPPPGSTPKGGCSEEVGEPAEGQRSQAADQDEPATPAPPTLPSQPKGPQQEADAGARLRERLAPWGLAGYADALVLKGYDADVLVMLNSAEAERMFEHVDCKPGHRVRFRRFFESQVRQV